MFAVSPDSIKAAIRQIERWMYASQQDTHPGISFLHANYAVADLDMLRQMVSDDVVIRVTGQSPLELWGRASALQDAAQQRLVKLCGNRIA